LGNGSDDVDEECYPKNLVRSIWILERKLRGLSGYKSSSDDEDIDEIIVAERQNGGNWLLNYVEPYLRIGIFKVMNMLVESAESYEPNTEDGRYEIHSF
jgi:hypothetical protein